jgi:hypothetical protein
MPAGNCERRAGCHADDNKALAMAGANYSGGLDGQNSARAVCDLRKMQTARADAWPERYAVRVIFGKTTPSLLGTS